MIENNIQYKISKDQADKLANAILDLDKVDDSLCPKSLTDAQRRAMVNDLNKLADEIKKYEKINGITV